jgi:hypothetical protein
MGGSWGRATAIIACILLAGCGGEDKKTGTADRTAPAPTSPAPTKPAQVGPRPAEPAKQAAERVAEAVEKNDCSQPNKLFVFDEVTRSLCKQLLPGVEPAQPIQIKAYGSGALMQTADGGRAILMLDSDRRYKVVTSFGGSLDIPTVPAQKADEAMSFVVGAIRRDDCGDIVRLSLTYSNGGSGKKFCALKPVRQLHAALDKHYTASPKPLGGDGNFAFYGLEAKPHYYTLLFIADRTGSTYLFVTAAEA